MSKLDELMALADEYVDSSADWEWGNPETEVAIASSRAALQSALKAVMEERDQLLAAASQARFALSELTPLDPDAGMTIKMLTAAIDAARKPGSPA